MILLISLSLITSFVEAQYKINKTRYDYRTYTYQDGDKYNPAVAGITSFLIPGLGQVISGETIRGLAFFGGFSLALASTSFGMIMTFAILGSGISGETPKRGRSVLNYAGLISI